MGGLGYIRPELREPNLDRPRDRFQSDHRTFPRFRFRQSGRADLARAISHRGSDSILSQPTFPPLFPALLRTTRWFGRPKAIAAAPAAAHGKVHYRSSISHSALRPREKGSLFPPTEFSPLRHYTLALPFDCTECVALA